jgi:hypothetical protein
MVGKKLNRKESIPSSFRRWQINALMMEFLNEVKNILCHHDRFFITFILVVQCDDDG